MANDIEKKLGQLFFIGFKGYTLSKKTKEFLRIIQPGGIIFFENNIKSKHQVKTLIKEINSLLEIKPFIAVDQEGGSVERLRNICTSTPSPWGLSKVGLKELLDAHRIIINELLELGFNMNLVPVLDINSNIQNPIIGTRSISANPTIVSEYGNEIIKLYSKYNIIPIAKHFPGHGDLTIDSHVSLPRLSKNLNELKVFELIPFEKAIQNKVPAIMAGHIQLPKLEKDIKRPASLSKDVLVGLLRKKLAFKGLIITDELNMKGVTKNFPIHIAAYEAIKAGADLVLFNFMEDSSLKAYEYIKGRISNVKAYHDSPLFIKRVEESYKRIISIKERFFKTKSRGVMHYAPTKYKQLSLELANKVVHWIKKDSFFKPIEKTESIEIIYPITPKLRIEDLKSIVKETGIKKHILIEYPLNLNSESIKRITKKLKRNSRKILITYDVALRNNQKKLFLSLIGLAPNLCVIAAGLEHDLEYLPKVKNLIAAYAPNYISLLAAFRKFLS